MKQKLSWILVVSMLAITTTLTGYCLHLSNQVDEFDELVSRKDAERAQIVSRVDELERQVLEKSELTKMMMQQVEVILLKCGDGKN